MSKPSRRQTSGRSELRSELRFRSGSILSLGDDVDRFEDEEEDEDDEYNQHDFEVEQLLNMFRIPLYLEKFMLFTLLASYDCFLYYFTELPYNVFRHHLKGFKKRMRGFLGKKDESSIDMRSENKIKENQHNRRELTKEQKRLRRERKSKIFQDKCTAFLIVVSVILLSPLDTSKVYHRIKRQSTVKLYVLFSLLEMSDQLLSSVGQSLLTVVVSHNCYKRMRHKQLCLLLLGVIYLTCHGYVLVYQTISLNIATNSCSNALLTLLLSMQFSEIKGSVFKKIDKEGLFQIGMSDVAERFKLLLFLSIIGLRNLVAKSRNISSIIPFTWCLNISSSGIQSSPTFNVIGSEIIVDWIKHAYITKFNRIRPEMYDKFYFIAYRDYTKNSTEYQNRLGIPLPASVVLFITMLRPVFFQPIEEGRDYIYLGITLVISMLLIFTAKMLLHYILSKWTQSIQRRFPSGEYVTDVNSETYVPGLISTGLSKMDEITRDLLNDEHESNGYVSPIEENGSANNSSAEALPLKSENSSRLGSPPAFSTDSSNKSPSPEILTSANQSLLQMPIISNGKSKASSIEVTEQMPLEEVTRYKMVSKRIW
ncbi:hypothetical protein RNJ44_03372 [Nakaseomyces bracarensis]|uniref:Uncharacterized protein n=1 Tax=Nakaseomyces bracarensis TaxID=273131 RepID=A0ABR4NZK1_9SACH